MLTSSPTQSPAGASDQRASRWHLRPSLLAGLLGLAVVVMLVAQILLGRLDHQSVNGTGASTVLALVPFVLVGFFVARRQPGNAIGWILLGVPFFLLLSGAAGTYAVWDYHISHGGLPFGQVAVFLQLGWAPAILLLPLPVLLFPDGKAPSPRWRKVLWCYLAIATLWALANVGVAASAVVGQHIKVDGSGQLTVLDDPKGLAALVYNGANSLLPVFAAFWLAWVVRLLGSFRHSSDERRQQIKWFLSGAGIAGVSLVLLLLSSTSSAAAQAVPVQLLEFVTTLGLAALPVGLGIAILKYRLYDVDRLISRTLSYAIVTGLLVGVYVGLVTLTTRVLPFSSPLGVAASTLAAAALFTPVRARVQRVADRRFNRARYDAEATVAMFAQRLREDVDLDVVSTELIRVVQSSVEPVHLSLWVRPPEAEPVLSGREIPS
ncbi:MAG: hypothetical protein WBA31_07115 [Candidatus Dormiibacterota bacterium]